MVERTYNVPLRKEWLKVPKYKRAKKAVKALKQFLARHMKTEISSVKIGKFANLKIWERGIRNPPHHIKVNVTKDDDGKVMAELVGAPLETPKAETKPKKKTLSEREKKKEEIRKRLEELKKKKVSEKDKKPAKSNKEEEKTQLKASEAEDMPKEKKVEEKVQTDEKNK